MTLWVKYQNIPDGARKAFWYYLFYCFVFIILQIGLTSTFAFFHFLLEHDMNSIENWLSRNTWEILVCSKVLALITTAKVLKLNAYVEYSFRESFKKLNYLPTKRAVGIVIFLLIFFYALIDQFGGGIQKNQLKEDLVYSSFFGSIVYYLADLVLFICVDKVYPFVKKLYLTVPLLLFLFLLSSKIALPYLDKYYIFLIVHFLSLVYFFYKDKVGDALFYTIFLIAPLSTVYGLDIVWDNLYSVFFYQEELPVVGIIGLWIIALGYYRFSQVD